MSFEAESNSELTVIVPAYQLPYSFAQNIPLSPIFMGHRFNPMLTFLLSQSNSFDQSNRVLLPKRKGHTIWLVETVWMAKERCQHRIEAVTHKNMSPLFPMTTLMYPPEMVSYDIAVIAKLMLWDTMFDKSRHHL
jgi:hypothetical protein